MGLYENVNKMSTYDFIGRPQIFNKLQSKSKGRLMKKLNKIRRFITKGRV
jgi:hypothetical protein